MQRRAGNAATAALLARRLAASAVLARQPDEEKVRERARKIWQAKGEHPQTPEQEQADWFEAVRQVEIEEQAYYNRQAMPAGAPVDEVRDYYEAERQVAQRRAGADAGAPAAGAGVPAPGVDVPAPGLDVPAPGLDVPAPGLDVPAPGLDVPAPALDVPAPALNAPAALVNVQAPAANVRGAYVPPSRRAGFVPQQVGPVAAAAQLAPGHFADAQLAGLGFGRAQARWQKNVADWNGFHVHISVNPQRGAFNEFHVKYDLGGRTSPVYFFFTAAGVENHNKRSRWRVVADALTDAGCPPGELDQAADDMVEDAKALARRLAGDLR